MMSMYVTSFFKDVTTVSKWNSMKVRMELKRFYFTLSRLSLCSVDIILSSFAVLTA